MKTVRRSRAIIAVTVVSLLIVAICAASFWTYIGTTRNQSEACKKWEEIKSQNERQMEASNSEIQQGVSIMQVREMKYRELCQENG